MTKILTVSLPDNSLYVTGTVNGITCTWTRSDGSLWTTIVDVSSDNVYRVVLQIVYGDGKVTTDRATLYYGLVLITDRTQEDVDYADRINRKRKEDRTEQETTDWNEGLKGTYGASDLNRVGYAMEYLESRLTSAGYAVDVSPYTLWKDSDEPSDLELNAYLGYVATIRDTMTLPSYTPSIPSSIDDLTFQDANNIEKVLEIVDTVLTLSLQFLFYSNDIFCGEV